MVRKSVFQLIRACDVFAQPAAFRFRDEPQYESLTGGVCSILMFIVFTVVFSNTVRSTFNKQTIDTKLTTVQNQDPTFYQVGTDRFMFAIGLSGINMTDTKKWFQITAEKTMIINGAKTKISIVMQACQKSQWTTIKPEFSESYDRIGLDSWLCPPPGTVIQLQGKFSSSVFKYYKFGVRKCDPLVQPNRTCANSTQIQAYLNGSETFTFNYYYLNTIINAGNKDFTSIYLDDLNYFPFTPTDGMTANFFLSSYEINTDQSIYPITSNTQLKGGISTTPAQTINYKVRQKDYLKFFIRKSSLQLVYDRSFRKIDDALSYIGGLFSAIVAALIIMKKYNEISYQLQIAKTLYHYNKNQPLKSDQFNLFVFLGYLIYAFFQTICIKLPWKRMEMYFRSLQQVRKQMDIRLVMKKILYSQRVAIAVFDQAKSKILHLQQPLTLAQAEQIRKDHLFYNKIATKFFDYKKIRKQDQQQQKRIKSISILGEQKSQQKQKTQQYNQNEQNNVVLYKCDSKVLIKPNQQKYKQDKAKHSVQQNTLNLLSVFADDQFRKQQQLKMMIQKTKRFVKVLQRQAQNGDLISAKILQKYDPKLRKLFSNTIQQGKQISKIHKQISFLSNYTINLENNHFPQ